MNLPPDGYSPVHVFGGQPSDKMVLKKENACIAIRSPGYPT